MSIKCRKFEENRQSENDYFRIQPWNTLKSRKMPKMGCQRENDRKSYHFLFGTFFDRGVHFEKQRRYEENKHYGCIQSGRNVGIASCKLQLIIFIMFKVQVQPSRKHKYHNYSTKKRGCSRDTSYLSNSPGVKGKMNGWRRPWLLPPFPL